MDRLSLVLFFFFVALCYFITRLILKIFPCLKKLNWKIIAGLFIFFKIFDIHSTGLFFAKTKFYEAEANIVFSLFYKILGLEPGLSFVLSTIIVIFIGIFAIKIFVNKRKYFIAFFLVVVIFLAAVNNYLGMWILHYL